MTTLFSDGFESGDFTAWTGTAGSPSVQSTIKHHGTYAAYFNATEYCYKVIAGQNVAYQGGCIYFNTLPGTGGKYAAVFGASDLSGTYSAFVAVSDNVFVLRTANGGAATDTSTGVTITANTWYYIEVLRNITTGHAELWINGASKASIDASFSNQSAIFGAGASITSGSPTIDFYIDCVVAADVYISPEITTYTKTFSLNVEIQKTLTKTFSLNTELQKTATAEFTLNAEIVKQYNATFTLNTELQKSLTKTFTLNAEILKQNLIKELTLNTELNQSLTKTFSVNTELQSRNTTSFTVNSELQKALTKTFTLNTELESSVIVTPEEAQIIINGSVYSVNKLEPRLPRELLLILKTYLEMKLN